VPLDPRIPLGVQPLQLPSPLEVVQTVAQIQGIREQTEARREQTELRRLAAEEARTKHLRQQQIDRAYEAAYRENPETGEFEIDYPALMRHLPGSLAPAVLKELNADRENAIELKTKTLALQDARTKALGSAAQTVVAAGGDPAIWGLTLRSARDLGTIDSKTFTELSQLQDPKQILALAQSYVQRAGLAPKETDFTLSAGQTRYGPGGEVIASQPAAPGDESFTLTPGAIRFGPGGEVIARGPAPQGPAPSYQWAVPPGASKPVLMTPQEIRTSGATSVSAAGEAGGIKLSAPQQAEIATMLTAEQMAADVAKLGAETNWVGVGPWEGRIGATALGSGGTKGETLRNQIGNIQATVALMRGGTSFTDTEKALLETYTPTTTDSDTKIKTKLTNLVDFIQKKRANVLRVAAGDYTLPSTVAPTTTSPAGAGRGGGVSGMSFDDYKKARGGR
jgi:hypothetical protein